MGVKDMIKQAGDTYVARAELRKNQKAEKAAKREADHIEAERQRRLRQKQENQARIKQLQAEAEEFAISFSDYLAFLNCKHMEEVEEKLDGLESYVGSLENDVSNLEYRMSQVEMNTPSE